MKRRNEEIKRLPDSELEVMQVIWDHEAPVSRKVIEESMMEIRPIAQTTLLTHLTRLADKDFLKIEKKGRSSAYTPLVSRDAYQAKQSRDFLDRLFGGDIHTFANALCDSGLSNDDLKELRDLLDKNTL